MTAYITQWITEVQEKPPPEQPQVVTTDNTLLNMKKIHRVRERKEGGRNIEEKGHPG